MKSFNPAPECNVQSNIVPFTVSSSRRHSVASPIPTWHRIWNAIFKLLTPNAEPRIVQKQEPDGNEYYQVYDPVTGHSKTFGSEQETRIWLDRRFYENTRNW